jgi:hypothetical protein
MDVSLGNMSNNNQESTGKMTLEQNTQDDESSCLDTNEPKIESKSGPFDKHSSTSGNTNNNCISDKTVGQMSARRSQQKLSSAKDKSRAETVNVTAPLPSQMGLICFLFWVRWYLNTNFHHLEYFVLESFSRCFPDCYCSYFPNLHPL